MRFFLGVVVVLLAPQPVLAQPDIREVVVRGCIVDDLERLRLGQGGLVLTALDPSRQAFESPNVDRDQRFSLVGDLLDELKELAGQEVEVTGQRILVQDVRDPILIEPPQDPGGFPGAGVIEPRRGFPGAGQQTPPGPQRDVGAAAAPQVTLVVTAYKSFSAFCRR